MLPPNRLLRLLLLPCLLSAWLATPSALARGPSFDELFHGQDVVMLLIDPDSGAIADANPAAARFYGYSQDQLRSMTIQDINTLTPEQTARERQRAAREGRSYFLFRHRLANGQVRMVESHVRPYDFDGRTLLLSQIHAITPRPGELGHYQQRLEILLDNQKAQLEQSRLQLLWLLALALVLQGGWIGYLLLDRQRRRRLQHRLNNAVATLANIMDSATEVAIIATDKDGNITAFNHGAEALTGYSADEIRGQQPGRFMVEEEIAQRAAELSQSLGKTVEGFQAFVEMPLRQGAERREWTLVRKDGRQMPVSLVITVIRDDTGGFHGYLGMATDITELKQAQAELVASEERLRTIFEILPVGIFLTDRDGQILDCNSASEQMLGLSHREHLRRRHDDPDWHIYRPDGSPMPKHELAGVRALAEQQPVRDMLMEVRKPDDSAWISVSATPLDHPRYGLVVSYVDVTEQHLANARLQLAASVFTHAREGIIIADARGTIIDVNDAFTRITGYQRHEALGRNARMLKSGRQSPQFYKEMWRALVDHGHWHGEIWNRRKNGELYVEMLTISAVLDDAGRTRHYVALFTDITLLKEHQKHLEHVAHYDALTGLPNRMLLAKRLRQAVARSDRTGRPMAVVYLDLDGFKAINDSHGHHVGDEMLVALSRKMRQALRDSDVLSRIGGDEFVAVLPDLGQPRDCEPVLNRLLQALSAPVQVSGQMMQVSGSLGVTLYPTDAVDTEKLVRHADQAMYQAKQAGKNRYHFFDVAQDVAIKALGESLADIRQALDGGQLVLHYQPKVNMRTGALVGVEALLRWQHPSRGLLPPSEFLPLVAERRLGADIDQWVLGQTLAQLHAWQQRGLCLPVSVNVGAQLLQRDDFLDGLKAQLARYPGLPRGSLELEVLETSALEDMGHTAELMQACQALGVHFALDDFGTGYSSLTYFRHLPADQLKIDRSFVRDMLEDPEDLAIVDGVIGLASAFRRQVVAEGVESLAHGRALLSLGCELGQGHGIARPMPASELPGWAAQWHPDPSWLAQQPSRREKDRLFVQVEYRALLRRLEAHLDGDQPQPPDLAEHDHRFQAWLAEAGWDGEALAVAAQLHQQLHELAQRLLTNPTEQRPRARLKELGGQLLERLERLREQEAPALRA
ncbi:EAL domain-containing protein [Gallaecimonas sp. GXIMD4217]|uniref:EAL domain-containing protein n=1 Tax=Gallaecimonas sp. GXIMD4217 TaxID=3131927 RepID=UPI00311ABE2C